MISLPRWRPVAQRACCPAFVGSWHVAPSWRDAMSGLLQNRTTTSCMVRPCVARSFVDLVFGLASMYPASDWSLCCSGPSWISARGRSHWRTGLRGQRDHQFSIAPGRPASISLLPLAVLGGKAVEYIVLHHRRLLISSVPWFAVVAVPSSRPAPSACDAHRRGQGRPGRAAAGHGLDGAEHDAILKQVGANHRSSSSLRSLVPW